MSLEEFREYFYYYRDKEKKPIVTVCLLEINGFCCRGIAICSKLDPPNKKVGRAIARGRAYKAMESKCCDPKYAVRRRDAADWMFKVNTFYPYKSVFDAVLTDYEKKLIGEKI